MAVPGPRTSVHSLLFLYTPVSLLNVVLLTPDEFWKFIFHESWNKLPLNKLSDITWRTVLVLHWINYMTLLKVKISWTVSVFHWINYIFDIIWSYNFNGLSGLPLNKLFDITWSYSWIDCISHSWKITEWKHEVLINATLTRKSIISKTWWNSPCWLSTRFQFLHVLK